LNALLGERLQADGVEVTEEAGLVVAAPHDEAGVIELVRRAAQDNLHVLPIGLGSKLSFCRPEATGGGFDFALSTRYLSGVCAYEPGDGTLSVQAGCRLSDLIELVRAGGHRLTPDVPLPGSATIGGVLGASLSGADRLLFGPVRHHVLGMRVVLADGSVAQSGGRLVKNVTGFDLHRLYSGSRGTLAITLDASLRLFPAPQAELAVTCDATDWQDADRMARELFALALRPTSLTLENRTGVDVWRLRAFFAGGDDELARRRDRAHDRLGARATWYERDRAFELRRHVRDLPYQNGWPQLRITSMPSRFSAGVTTTLAYFERAGLTCQVVAQPGVACGDVWIAETEHVDAEMLADLRERLAPGEVELQPRALPVAVHSALAKRPNDGPAARWMDRLRATFDPAGRFQSPCFPLAP